MRELQAEELVQVAGGTAGAPQWPDRRWDFDPPIVGYPPEPAPMGEADPY